MCLGTHNLGTQKEPVLLLYWQKTGSSNFVFCLHLYFVCLLFPAFSVFISPQAFTYFKYNINAMACTDTPTAKARWVLIYMNFQICSKVYKTDSFP